MNEYIFIINDDYEDKILTERGDSSLKFIANDIAENYLDDNFEEIDSSISNGLRIEIFNKERLLLGIFHVNVEYTLSFSAREIKEGKL